MFQSRKHQEKKTGLYGVPRNEYLQKLVIEFQETSDREAKEQILANLANFAYDPINYEFLRELHVLDLFLDMLTEPSEKLVEFAIGGICNCCIDPQNRAIIVENEGLQTIIDTCLQHSNEEIVLSAITSLLYMLTPETQQAILTPVVVGCMRRYASSMKPRLRNLATVFLQDSASAIREEIMEKKAAEAAATEEEKETEDDDDNNNT
eukprot:GEZU01022626.1.p1 GENE.GEZU01022626.1~~GEZU01022626.1.p1  ORF type:complete len:207 (+),score=52.61 GEZU01022626.1:255-875(+)